MQYFGKNITSCRICVDPYDLDLMCKTAYSSKTTLTKKNICGKTLLSLDRSKKNSNGVWDKHTGLWPANVFERAL
jgi:hypothetical protein